MLNREALTGSVDVLIADDDALLRKDVRSFLELQGYSCAEARDGREAVAIAQRRIPQCILLDLGIPGLDGYTVTRQLRSDPLTQRAHIHCLTGRSDPASRQRATEAGCELFLTKPVDPTTLLQVVTTQVTRAQREWVTGLSKSQADALLDWLEANGYPPAEFTFTVGVGFAVRCAQFTRSV
jgi:CheY-like chemotaxis protein